MQKLIDISGNMKVFPARIDQMRMSQRSKK